MEFECDPDKEAANLTKHGVDFSTVEAALSDPHLIVNVDTIHSTELEQRFFGIGHDGRGILTVRFTVRDGRIRVLGAGYWRKQKKEYENQK